MQEFCLQKIPKVSLARGEYYQNQWRFWILHRHTRVGSQRFSWLFWFMCSPCHIRCVEIFVKPRNCCRTWNILVVVFLNCSCEINFRAPSRPSRYRKGFVIGKKYSTAIPSFFLTQQKIKKVNKQSSSTKISRFDENFYASNMTWRAH